MLPSSRARRGYTIVEVLAVVAIVGILAALAMFGFRKYLHAASASEAKNIMQGIHLGEQIYRQDNLGYLSCSASMTAYFPHATPDDKKWSWIMTSHPDWPQWERLGIKTDQVKLVYVVMAGPPGTAPDAVPEMTNGPAWPAASDVLEPWFVVHAIGDVDGDGVHSSFVSSSFNHEIYSENEDE